MASDQFQTYPLLKGFAQRLRNKGRQATTVESYHRDASRFLEYLAKNKLLPNRVEAASLIQYQQHLTEDCKEKENTVRRAVIGVRQFYRYLQEEKVIAQTPFDFVPIPERNETLPELDLTLIEKVLKDTLSPPSSFIDARNGAIAAFIAFEGIKATELIAMTWQDLMLDGSTPTAVIRGAKSRTIRLSEKTVTTLKGYRKFYTSYQDHPKIKQSQEKHLLIAFKGRDASVLIPHMSRHGLKFIIYEMGIKAGIPHLNTELLRHYAVSQLISSGRAAEEIMEHLGLRRMGNVAKHFSQSRKAKLDDPAFS